MSVVSPNGRAQLEYTGLGLRIMIPTKKNWFAILFLPCWLVGWLFGEVEVSALLITGKSGEQTLFLVFWLLLWTLGGGFALLALLWQLAGKQVIMLQPGFLSVENKIFQWGTKKTYDLSLIKNVRLAYGSKNSIFSASWGMEYWGFGKGHIAFNYGMKTINIAPFIDEPEAQYLIGKLNEKGLA